MADYGYLKKFVEYGSYENAVNEKMSDNYSKQYNEAISSFEILINSDRANTIYRNGISYKCIVDYGGVLKKNELNNDMYRKEVKTRHSDNFKGGNVVEFENKNSKEKQNYLFLKSIETKEGYDLSTIQKCNHILKWQRNSLIHTYPTVVFSRTAFKDDVYADKTMTIASGQFQLYVTSDENTILLNIEDRFYIGRDVYKIAYVDETTLDGTLIFTLNKSLTKNVNDNDELRIADYIEPTDTTTPPEDNGGDLW